MAPQKPVVCLIDVDQSIATGWRQALAEDATLLYFKDHLEYFDNITNDSSLTDTISCFIISRYCSDRNVDIVRSDIPEKIRQTCVAPIFLNWQGYISKEELRSKFDGKLFHRYGVKWQTLRLRVTKAEQNRRDFKQHLHGKKTNTSQDNKKRGSRSERCNAILQMMAKQANGSHREKIDYLAKKDAATGILLLEKLYNQLVINKNETPSCLSRYINSSPVIAQRMLREALF